MNRSDVRFVAEGSLRYHRSRAEHFQFRNKYLTILGVFLGTGIVVSSVAASHVLTTLSGVLVALINVYRLVAKPDQVAREHEDWCRKWSKLCGEVTSTAAPSPRQLKDWIVEIHDLNASCLEDMKAVKAHAYNETMASLGLRGVPYRINHWQRWTMHLFSHRHGFDDQNLEGATAA